MTYIIKSNYFNGPTSCRIIAQYNQAKQQQRRNSEEKRKQHDSIIEELGQNCNCNINVFHSIGYTPYCGNEKLKE
jgi:hypothetical protein